MRGGGSPEQLLSILRDSARGEVNAWLDGDGGGGGSGDEAGDGAKLGEHAGGMEKDGRNRGGGAATGHTAPRLRGGVGWGGGGERFDSGGEVRFMSCDRRDLLPSGDQMRDIIHQLKLELKVTADAQSSTTMNTLSS